MAKGKLFLRLASAVALMLSAMGVSTSASAQYAYAFSGGPVTLTVNGTDSITSSDTGWWSTGDTSDNSNTNYVTGKIGAYLYNDFFVFPLSGLSSITSATLSLDGWLISGTLTYRMYDVTTPIATLEDVAANPNTAIYNDLGSGVYYGGGAVTDGESYTTINFMLNAAGIAAMNAAIANGATSFAIGGTVNAIATPEPSTWAMMLVGFAGFVLVGYCQTRSARGAV
jgi:hypothetical protein